jgi:hypothetical protein
MIKDKKYKISWFGVSLVSLAIGLMPVDSWKRILLFGIWLILIGLIVGGD